MEEYDVKVPNIAEGTYLIRVGLSNASVTSGSFIDNQNRAVINMLTVTNASFNSTNAHVENSYVENRVVRQYDSSKNLVTNSTSSKYRI